MFVGRTSRLLRQRLIGTAARVFLILPIAVVATHVAFAATAAAAAEHEQKGAKVLGTVHFPVTCSAAAQQAFNYAMKLQHAFAYQAAHDAFSQVLERDPQCVMAHWGIAMSLLHNPFSPPLAKSLSDGWEALEAARRIGARSEREAGYVEALSVFYRDAATKPHRARVMAYSEAMAALHARHPEDTEAAVLYALSLVVAAPPTDKTYAMPLKAASILEKEFARQPDHPGVPHYLIHAYDYPALAERGLASARRFAAVAPDSAHALHMPSHVFTRLGSWQDSIETNRRSADIARKEKEHDATLHALDYLTYALLQTAQDEAARKVLDELDALARLDLPRPPAQFALAAIPARFAVERGAWAEAARLAVRPGAPPYAQAMTRLARAVGSARAGDPQAATAEAGILGDLAARLRKGNDAYWAEMVDIWRLAASAWAERAGGNLAKALALLQAAAEREAKTEKHVLMPGPLAPARELLGEMLLEAGKPEAAFAEFERSLGVEPNRFRSLHGAARAAELAGLADAARRYFGRLVELSANADAARPELEAAKAFLRNRPKNH